MFIFSPIAVAKAWGSLPLEIKFDGNLVNVCNSYGNRKK